MFRFFLRRLTFALLLVVAVSSGALFLTRLAPGDVTANLGAFARPEEVARTRARFDLDRSAAAQWGGWALRAIRFDFGDSFLYNRPVGGLIQRAAGNTAVLAVAALALATLLGIPLGIISGSRRGVAPALIRGASLVCLSIPPLLTSLLLVFVASRTGWLPAGGMTSVDAVDAGLVVVDPRRRAAPSAAGHCAGAADCRHVRAAAGAVDGRDDPSAVCRRGARARRDVAAAGDRPRVARVAPLDVRGLRPGDRRAPLRLLRRRIRDRLARASDG